MCNFFLLEVSTGAQILALSLRHHFQLVKSMLEMKHEICEENKKKNQGKIAHSDYF